LAQVSVWSKGFWHCRATMADLIPDPTKPGRIEGSELKGARDALQERVLKDTTWCVYCLYGGCGLDGMDLPCFFCTGEICCMGGTTKLTGCYTDDGCVTYYSKCCCCLVGCEYPIDNSPGFRLCCGPCCLSNIEDRTLDDCSTVAGKNELDTLKSTLFCCALQWCYSGFTYDISPLCSNEGKLCCLWVSTGSASCCGDDGYIEHSGKCCCVVTDCSCPAGYTPGIACCGTSLCCAKMPENAAE